MLDLSINKKIMIPFILLLTTSYLVYRKNNSKIDDSTHQKDFFQNKINQLEAKIQNKNDQIDILKRQLDQKTESFATSEKPLTKTQKITSETTKEPSEKSSSSEQYVQNAQKKMLKTTLSNTYKKFFEEINLNEDDQEKFNDIIATIKLSEYSNNLKIFDESISIDDLLKEQSQFNEQTDVELIKIIGRENIESFKEFNQKLKTNTVAQQYEVYLQELNISEDLRSKLNQTLYKQIEKNLDPSFGEWTYDDIYNAREKYQGAQMGSKKFFEVSIKHYENKNKPITGISYQNR